MTDESGMPRSLSDAIGVAVTKHAAQIGKVAIAWNNIQTTLSDAFVYLVTPGNRKLGYAIWNELRSDRGQREMLLGALKVHCAEKPRLLAEYKWVFGKMQGLEDRRNDVIHSPYGIMIDWAEQELKMFADTSSGNKRAASLANRKFDEECTGLVRSLDRLSRYVKALIDPLHSREDDGEFPDHPKV